MKWFLAIFFSVSFVFLAFFGVTCVYGYLFPMKYNEEIESVCEKYEMDKATIYSLINIESHFRKDVISPKGAIGLMQVMSATASELANSCGLSDFDLKNPADNIAIGTFYLKKLLNRFDNLQTALAAYNAGPTNVKNWLKDERYSVDGINLKNIPFEETKEYVNKFNKNFKYYKAKLG